MAVRSVEGQSDKLLLAGQRSLYLLDERFPGTPVVRWSHMLIAPPTMISGFYDETEGLNGFVLGSRELGELQLLSGRFRSDSGCFTGSSQPTQLSTPEEIHLWSRSRRPELWGNRNFLEILTAPLRGLASLALGDRNFAVFQLRDTGDLFYQLLTAGVNDR